MKKFIMCLTGAILILSMAACTPTPKKQTEAALPPDMETSTGGISDKVPDPDVEPLEIISVYSNNKDNTGLTQAMDALDELTAQKLVDKLVEYGVLEDGTKAVKYDAEGATGTLDLSKVPSKSGLDEKLLLTAIGNTFTENFGLEELKLLVNGQNYSGGTVKQGDKDYLEYVRDYKNMK